LIWTEIWGSEVTLYYPGLYAGATDLCGVYQGRESIVDFKQTNKPKRDEWITDYKLQMAAYAMAHDYVYGTNIEQGVILMCTPDCFFQRFIINGQDFRNWKGEWLRRVDQYYENRKATSDASVTELAARHWELAASDRGKIVRKVAKSMPKIC
jgi:hypothetical protein